MGYNLPAAQDKTACFFLPRGHRPLLGLNLENPALYEHRLHWKNCGNWSPYHHCTEQVGMQEAVYIRRKVIKF